MLIVIGHVYRNKYLFNALVTLNFFFLNIYAQNPEKFTCVPFQEKFDEEVLQDGVKIYIDKKAQLSILGTEMDFQESKLASEFVFNNPNITGTCGCGESFSL